MEQRMGRANLHGKTETTIRANLEIIRYRATA